MKLYLSDDAFPHVVASVVTAAALLLFGRLLFWALNEPTGRTQALGLRVIFIERMRESSPIAPPPSPEAVRGDVEPATAPRNGAARGPESLPARTAPSLIEKLYTREGRVKLPPGVAIDPVKAITRPPETPEERAKQFAKRLFDRPKAVDYKETRFEKDWVGDGTLGDRAAQKFGKPLQALQALSKMVMGEDQPAIARPPPDVPFNPKLHERPSDLGSAATGDAYKAAPIAFEKAPGLKGEASKRIRAKLGELQKRLAGCDQKRLQGLLAPARAYLADLERAEYALAHGADPIQAEHLLPRVADTAYDQARRAIWYAERQLTACDAD